MNRDDFQELAHKRLRDARVLLRGRRHAGAYYLTGYAVECGLKACIARQTRRFDFPPKPNAVRDIYVHDLTKLVKAAGLQHDLDEELKRAKNLAPIGVVQRTGVRTADTGTTQRWKHVPSLRQWQMTNMGCTNG